MRAALVLVLALHHADGALRERRQRGGGRAGLGAEALLGGARGRAAAFARAADGGFMDTLSSAGSALSGAASSVAGTAMNDAYDESCVMCEYILEQVDKMIKAQPRLMQGNGFYPGTVDFGGGVQQGNYRVYQGTYLEVAEQQTAAAKAEAATETSRRKGAVPRRKGGAAPAWYGRSRRDSDQVQRRRNHRGTTARSASHAQSRFDASFLESFTQRQQQRKRRQQKEKDRQGPPAPRASSQRQQRKGHDPLPTARQGAALTRFQQLAAKSQAMSGAQAKVEGKIFETRLGVLSARSRSRVQKGGSKGGSDLLGKAASAVTSGAAAAAKAVVRGVTSAASAVARAVGGKPTQQGGAGSTKQPIQGRHTFQDVDLTDDQVEKDKEFTTMYKDFMDAMDDVCFHDLPKSFQKRCQYMYYYGDRIVEMYLHDYDDFEICAQVPMQCTPTWFDEGQKSMWRR